MSIAAQLRQSVARHAELLVMPVATRAILQGLDRDCPVDTGKLRGSRKVVSRVNASSLSLTVSYPTKIANYTNEGTTAHPILPRKKGGRLRFVVDGRVVFARRVMWRPGAGVRKNIGWFTKNTNQTAWQNALRRVR